MAATPLKAEINNKKKKWKEWQAGMEEALYGKTMPHAPEFEQAVLGAVIHDHKAYREISAILHDPEVFYLESHQIIFQAIQNRVERSQPIDLLMVTEEIKRMGKLDDIGGAYYIVELTNKVGSSANIVYHARIIAEKWLARDGIQKNLNALREFYIGAKDVFNLRNELSDDMRVMPFSSYLRVRTGNQVMIDAAKAPAMPPIMGPLLLKGEMSFLFAKPGLGKSILGVQLSVAAALGEDVFPNILPNEAGPLNTGFFDFELMDNEFFTRYSEPGNPGNVYQFPNNWFRVDINPEFTDLPEGMNFDKYALREIETAIVAHELEFVIIDNLTALSASSSSDPQIAINIMNALKRLRIKYNLTILVVGHPTKAFMQTTPIEMYDMGGSAALHNFATNMMAIGNDVNDSNLLYIKQVKGRSGMAFHSDNIIICNRTKKNQNFLQLEFERLGEEKDHLAQLEDYATQEGFIEAAIAHRKQTGQGWRKTAAHINYPYSFNTLRDKVNKYQAESAQPELVAEKGNAVGIAQMNASRTEPDKGLPF